MKNNISKFREKMSMSQIALADEVGVNLITIDEIEEGKYTPSLSLAMRIAKCLGATVEELFEDKREGFDFAAEKKKSIFKYVTFIVMGFIMVACQMLFDKADNYISIAIVGGGMIIITAILFMYDYANDFKWLWKMEDYPAGDERLEFLRLKSYRWICIAICVMLMFVWLSYDMLVDMNILQNMFKYIVYAFWMIFLYSQLDRFRLSRTL